MLVLVRFGVVWTWVFYCRCGLDSLVAGLGSAVVGLAVGPASSLGLVWLVLGWILTGMLAMVWIAFGGGAALGFGWTLKLVFSALTSNIAFLLFCWVCSFCY